MYAYIVIYLRVKI